MVIKVVDFKAEDKFSQRAEYDLGRQLDFSHIPLSVDLKYPTECSGPPHLLGPWGRRSAFGFQMASSYHFQEPTDPFIFPQF